MVTKVGRWITALIKTGQRVEGRYDGDRGSRVAEEAEEDRKRGRRWLLGWGKVHEGVGRACRGVGDIKEQVVGKASKDSRTSESRHREDGGGVSVIETASWKKGPAKRKEKKRGGGRRKYKCKGIPK